MMLHFWQSLRQWTSCTRRDARCMDVQRTCRQDWTTLTIALSDEDTHWICRQSSCNISDPWDNVVWNLGVVKFTHFIDTSKHLDPGFLEEENLKAKPQTTSNLTINILLQQELEVCPAMFDYTIQERAIYWTMFPDLLAWSGNIIPLGWSSNLMAVLDYLNDKQKLRNKNESFSLHLHHWASCFLQRSASSDLHLTHLKGQGTSDHCHSCLAGEAEAEAVVLAVIAIGSGTLSIIKSHQLSDQVPLYWVSVSQNSKTSPINVGDSKCLVMHIGIAVRVSILR